MAKKRTSKKSGSTPVKTIRHKDKRKNIPTEELRDFVTEEEQTPKTMLYPRDPSLDPQLVWQGKDQQDREDLAVPVVPIYIQEKIHPQAIIDDLRRNLPSPSGRGAGGEGGVQTQLDLFADFNGLPEEFDQRVDFYHHDGNWSNRMILGDSLLVMTSLAEKEGLKGKVQCIYIDPPYGIKFGSNWQVSTRKRDVKDGKVEDASRQPEQVRAFRDTWKLGIHSYLAYLRDRLVVARELLTETGSVFVQIGDENVHLVRSLLDEVFGAENFAGIISFYKTASQSTIGIPSIVDYLIVYAKQKEHQKLRPLLRLKQPGDRGAKQYLFLISPDFKTVRRMTTSEIEGSETIPNGWKVCALGPTTSQGYQANRSGPYVFEGETFHPSSGRHWSLNPSTGMEMDRLARLGRLRKAGDGLRSILLAEDNPTTSLDNVWMDTGTGSFTEDQVYVVQTTTKAIERCLLMTTDPGDLVLDPTCGSGTTAYVAEQWGRRWITCDTSRVALALARTRLMAAKYPYYYLAGDYPQITQINADEEIKNYLRKSAKSANDSPSDIRQGFVYKRVPHVTLKSIANNPDIKEGMTRAEIDAAIARHAETETLFDQPYEDKKTVRVSGPFTVESLSPHRTISVEEKKQRSEEGKNGWKMKVIGPDDFATMILDNLRKAGVQNTIKGERLKFDLLEPFAGEWIHAQGRYTEKDGTERRAAICIGPEYGTVGAALIKEAAKEAVRGIGFDILLVCGFAFDPHVSEEKKRYGKLTVLTPRMNNDLTMGDEFLKKTGAGNLFMEFGEPDVEIRRINPQITQMDADKKKDKKKIQAENLCKSVQSADQIVVEIKGLDVYDPTTGQIRNSSTDDIACWFIDTDYNGESFFVRHAYFTGAEEPYVKLKRALRAEIDEAAWSALYSTVSRPFDRPETGKIAVKVINHYGDEVLKVYEV
ncbi:MAG: site-specific DNA-methyltransferase [Pirellulales bacterium]|nr:site-specific DNA-methyltransferase [Pirellulales bacterium]